MMKKIANHLKKAVDMRLDTESTVDKAYLRGNDKKEFEKSLINLENALKELSDVSKILMKFGLSFQVMTEDFEDYFDINHDKYRNLQNTYHNIYTDEIADEIEKWINDSQNNIKKYLKLADWVKKAIQEIKK